MWKGFCGVFNHISNPNIFIEKRFKKLEYKKTLDIA